MNDLLLRAARGERTERPPVWMMRQAGRHLPEYRSLREQHSFKEAIETPEIAAELTLQPWERYRPDGVVIFSDILPVIEPLGFSYHVESGFGPVVENPINDPAEVPSDHRDVASTLGFVGDLLALLKARIGDEVPLIGFAGGPVTLASYLVGDRRPRPTQGIRRFRVNHPDAFQQLLAVLTSVVREHLRFQIDAGADLIQLFDTYAGAFGPADYREFVLPYHRAILAELGAPSIIFARHMAGRLDLLAETGADVVGLDWTVDMAEARASLGSTPVQGNLDPTDLFGPEAFIRERTRAVIEAAGEAGHILNLGHGLHRETPVEGVAAFVETAKSVSR